MVPNQPCPFCGEAVAMFTAISRDDANYAAPYSVRCTCSANGPAAITEDAAWRHWNIRLVR